MSASGGSRLSFETETCILHDAPQLVRYSSDCHFMSLDQTNSMSGNSTSVKDPALTKCECTASVVLNLHDDGSFSMTMVSFVHEALYSSISLY